MPFYAHENVCCPVEIYTSIRSFVITAQNKVYTAVNSAMVIAYWEIGEQIYKACGENDRAEYGKNLLKYLSDRLTAEFGKSFDESNLRRMRQFYMTYPIRDTLCHELSWSHYRILMKIADKTVRDFYTDECAKSAWSVRQLERQINTMYYQRLLASKDKSSVAAEIQTSTPKPEYEKAIKDPYIMEFLQIKPDTFQFFVEKSLDPSSYTLFNGLLNKDNLTKETVAKLLSSSTKVQNTATAFTDYVFSYVTDSGDIVYG